MNIPMKDQQHIGYIKPYVSEPKDIAYFCNDDGEFALTLLQEFSESRVKLIGADNYSLLNVAGDRISFRSNSIYDFDVNDSKVFDLIVCINALSNFNDLSKAFKQMNVLLKPNAFLYVNDFQMYKFVSGKILTNGFELVNIEFNKNLINPTNIYITAKKRRDV
ncbi:MAG: class I SAM-dependent methyltransferase [Candidatus Nanoarchaeia archaeon]